VTFTDRYGPWALVAGASEGVGRVFAETLAERGLNVVLLARRQQVLDEVAEGIQQRFGVETRTLTVDLSDMDAAAQVVNGVSDLEIGFFVYCAGADPNYKRFLDSPLETAESMLHRNCTVSMQLCHHLCGPMAEKGRGAAVLFGSGAGFAGAANMVAYGASKAFDMVFAEALWCELKPRGVDVLGLILGDTDTPALRRLRMERGLQSSLDEPAKGADSPRYVVEDALANLTKGPTRLVSKKMRRGMRLVFPWSRHSIVKMFARASEKVMGKDPVG